MRSRSRLVLSIVALPILIAGLLGACSSDDSSTDTAAATKAALLAVSAVSPFADRPA